MPPGPVPPGKPGGSGSTAKVLLIVALVVVVAGGAALLLGGGDDDSGGGGGDAGRAGGEGDPVAAVSSYLDAASAGDCGALVDLVTASSRELMGASSSAEAQAFCESELATGGELAGAGVTLVDPTVVSNDGETAIVEAAAEADGDTETTQITLRYEDGAWKVDLTAIGGGGSSPPPPGPPADGGGAAGP